MLEEAKAHNSKWGEDGPSSKMQAIKGLSGSVAGSLGLLLAWREEHIYYYRPLGLRGYPQMNKSSS